MAVRFHDYMEDLRPLLERGFTDHLACLLDGAAPQPLEQKRILTGGKRVRGSLLCLVTTALGGPLEEALPRAIAVELIQTATLVHDDFIDQHTMRRNAPALWTLEGARRAVLLGDVIFASAIEMMAELGREDAIIASRAIAEVSRGAYQELLDPTSLLERMEREWDGELYEKLIYLKTAVLFAAACELGALAAKADDRRLQAWRRYGLKIGEAYQIADDLHEVERCLLRHSPSGDELASLAPALLFFAEETRPHILDTLRQKSIVLSGEFLTHLDAAAGIMRTEIGRRLRSVVVEMDEHFPDNDYGRIARRAPWDIIAMFNKARTRAFSP
jgi:geranylgeranyl pyrophosphate synthase